MSLPMVTLFAGGGLADVGCKAAGYEPVFAVEWDADIAGVYADNHGGHVAVQAVQDADYRPYADAALLWASPSCVNASVAKTDAGEAPEDRAAAEGICRALREIRPARFVLENVSGYRHFESFHAILKQLLALGYGLDYGLHNAADYGVPQTRRRLILRALRDRRFVSPLCPTHTEEPGDVGLFSEVSALMPWVGWYEAVEDLLPGLAESAFAPWQLARLPESLGTCLVDAANQGGGYRRSAIQPCGTVETYQKSCLPRAFLVEDRRGAGFANETVQTRDGAEPAPSIRAFSNGGCAPKALLVQGTSTLDVRDGGAPSAAVMATVHEKAACPKALLVSNAKTEYSDGLRDAGEPALTATQEHGGRLRAWLDHGRVVKLDARCLARFQSVPDTYRLPVRAKLAFRVVGNGVACLMAQRIAESLR